MLKIGANETRYFRQNLDSDGPEVRLLAGDAFDLASTLAVFQAIVLGLEEWHGRMQRHLALCPANIRLHEDGSVELRNDTTPPLAYISPEQTGRMNRSVDYRSDLYSIGVVFYQLLTGQLPFSGAAAMEIIHGHIARQARLPSRINHEVPHAVSSIVMKLLAKNAEDRYQSLQGLQADLQTCRAALEKSGDIADFELGRADATGHLQLPQRLYGREAELAQLLRILERSAAGTCELALVSGYAGIGKSSLIHELHKPVLAMRGYFISGKFDQFKRNIPYYAIAQVFGSLMRQILTESESRIQEWKARILAALGPNAQLMIDAIPELAHVIGAQPVIAHLGPTEALNRFRYVVQNFVSVFARQEHPLVIVLDDLHWADEASLDLIEAVMTGLERAALLLVVACRDSAADAGHVHDTLQAIRARAAVTTLHLQPMNEATVCALIADALKTAQATVLPLAQTVNRKTLGNPFFVGEFIKNLRREDFLCFHDGQWRWKLAEIEALQIADNVVDLLTRELARLPVQTRRLLQFAACIGNHFDCRMLATLAQQDVSETCELLQPALQAGLIMAPDTTFDGADTASFIYRFQHDRVQQAAYAEIPVDAGKSMHLQIGRLLNSTISEAQRSEHLFDIAHHLNAGRDLLASHAEKIELASLNLLAARKAKVSVAHETAWKLASTALELLYAMGEGSTALYFSLQLEQMESGFMTHRFKEIEYIGKSMLEYAADDVQKARVYDILIHSCLYQDRHADGQAVAFQALRMLGINVPVGMGKPVLAWRLWMVKRQLGRLDNQGLLDFRPEDVALELLKQKILSRAVSASYVAHPALFPILTLEQIQLALARRRFSPGLPWALGGYAMVMIQGGRDIALSTRLGNLMLESSQKNQPTLQKDSHGVRVAFLAHAAIFHWSRHLREAPAPLYENYQAGLEVGEFEYACYSLASALRAELLVERSLERLEKKLREGLDRTGQFRQKTTSDAIAIFIRYVLAMRTGGQAQVVAGEKVASSTRLTLLHHYLFEAMGAYAFDQFEVALERVRDAEPYLASAACMPSVPLWHFYHALCLLACYDQMDEGKRSAARRRIGEMQDRLKLWARHAPMNYLHKWQLVQAELKRVQGKFAEAAALYDLSIDGARQHGYLHEEALANELAARCHLVSGKKMYARSYMSEAYARYQEWGALAKLEHLERVYPGLLLAGLPLQDAAQGRLALAPAEHLLDIETVIQASNTLSGEIQLDKLLERLMRLLIENAGAERGALLLLKDGTLQLQASIESDLIEVSQAVPLDERAQLSLSVINYVRRTCDELVLSDAGNDGRFNADDYIARNRPKSLLCIPLQKQGALVGILYLENNLAVDAFTPERTGLLQILSTQIAISLENATLYHDLERKIVERTRDLSVAKEAAESANRAKSEFLAVMSHEIRTPMNGMLGMMQLAAMEAANPSQKEYLETAQYSAEALLSILNDILDFSRLEAGSFEFESISFDLVKTIESVIDLMSVRAREKGIALHIDYPAGMPRYVLGDVGRLRQVLLNLFGNALKFTERGSITLKIGLLPESPGRLRFTVSDTGIGIAPAAQSRLFQSFSQADNSITRRFGGTGLGLSICKRIVEMQGGQIGIQSVEGTGSDFWFELNLPAADAPHEKMPISQALASPAGALTILVAEDNVINQKVALSLLQKAGHQVHVVADGRAAVEAVRARPYDVILMDMHMPEMDGLEATRLIRAMEAPHSGVPIVALTAAGAVSDVQICLDAGMNYFLSKPIRVDRLRAVLMELSEAATG